MKLLARGALIAAILMALLSVQPPLSMCGLGCFPASCRAVGCSLVFSVILLRWSPINYMMGGGGERQREAPRLLGAGFYRAPSARP